MNTNLDQIIYTHPNCIMVIQRHKVIARKFSTTVKMFLWVAALCLMGTITAAQLTETLEFDLPDAYGRMVNARDYAGSHVLLEFGACW